MTDTQSARLVLPLLQPGQAQKEMTHNEALALLDLAVQPGALTIGDTAPPADPVAGNCWIIGDAPTGDWVGMADHLAGWTEDGWRFVSPLEGMTVWLPGDGVVARFTAGGWTIGDVPARRLLIDGIQVIGAQAAAIADPEAGAMMDAEVRETVAQILVAMRSHGLIAS